MVTGGPESLHNLCNLLSSSGFNAQMVYYPYAPDHTVPLPYVKYQVKVAELDDSSDVAIVFPETLCMPALRLNRAHSCIWWLSVDAFLEVRDYNLKDTLRYYRRALKGKRPFRGIKALSSLTHFSKCHYDEEFLDLHHIPHLRLSGPISHTYIDFALNNDVTRMKKNNVILYNPKKTSPSLIAQLKDYSGRDFMALSNLDEIGLIETFSQAKIYIDFGNHPGLERMPREAVVCGCCVITGRRGSAANPFDIPIPEIYKIDENSSLFANTFNNLVNLIIDNYEARVKDFDMFRHSVLISREIQKSECLKIMKELKIQKI